MGWVLYGALALFVIATPVVQVTRQVFFAPAPRGTGFATCQAGIAALYDAIERGRVAAEHGDDDDEEAALLRYREAVAPDWAHRDAIAETCRGEPRALTVLDAIERLRYSEEHSVRHQAVELTALRRRVKALVATVPGR